MLLSGETVFTTRGYKMRASRPSPLSDGPNGVRKQAGGGPSGLNPSVPATCFPDGGYRGLQLIPPWANSSAAMGRRPRRRYPSCWGWPQHQAQPAVRAQLRVFRRTRTSGKMAAAYVRGIQSNGIAALPKHFAVNSQERRMASDSVVDERTLREPLPDRL